MNETYQALRLILKKYESELDGVRDSELEYYLNSKVMEKGNPIFIGMVKASKAKVAFHLMPVYFHPDLLEGVSSGLRNKMQGKSCFNFSKMDSDLLEELKILTDLGFKAFQKDGRI